MSPLASKSLAVSVLVCVWSLAPAQAGFTVSFDESQLVNNDPLLTLYDGGTTYRGIGGAPNYGVSFTINARVFTQTTGLVGTFTTPGIMELYSDTDREGAPISAIMNVGPGFGTSVLFDYAAIDSTGSLKVYDGPNGTGNVLANVSLPVTSPVTGPGTFIADAVTFSGVGQSIVFDGGNKQLAFDDLTFQAAPVPEPATCTLFATGALSLMFAARRWRHRGSKDRR